MMSFVKRSLAPAIPALGARSELSLGQKDCRTYELKTNSLYPGTESGLTRSTVPILFDRNPHFLQTLTEYGGLLRDGELIRHILSRPFLDNLVRQLVLCFSTGRSSQLSCF